MRKNLCNAILYENMTNPGIKYLECGFWRYIELRKAELGKQEDIKIIRTVRGWPSPLNIFWCLIRKTKVIDDRPQAPEGEYRIG